MKSIVITPSDLRVSLRPDLGTCIEGMCLHGVPVLRSSAPGTLANVRLSACYPLPKKYPSNPLPTRQSAWHHGARAGTIVAGTHAYSYAAQPGMIGAAWSPKRLYCRFVGKFFAG